MSSGYSHNRNRNSRDSPSTPVSSSSSRPRSNSKNSSDSNQKNRNPTVNGKMPSVANSPTSGSDHIADGMAGLVLDNVRHPIGTKVTAKVKGGSNVLSSTLGSTVIKGEIMAYDSSYKMVILKSSASRPGRNNVSFVNLANCIEIKVDEEGKEAHSAELQPLNTQRLEQRLKTEIEKKKKLIMAFKAGISPEGQRLFQVINKTLDDVMWNGDKIVVMGVTIEPPYRPESIKSREDNKALNHIRKIVEKHIRDLEATKSSASTTTSTSALSVAASPSAATVAAETTPATSTNSRTSTPSVTPSIPNLPQAPAPGQPSSHSGSSKSSNFRSNRNNPGRNSNRQHHDYHSKTIYPWAKNLTSKKSTQL